MQRAGPAGFLQKKEGFTLIESIVAITILVGAIFGPLTLITRGIYSVREVKDKLIAANLAQEGIEIIRAFRDSNILTGCMTPLGASDWRALVDASPGCTRLAGGAAPGSDWEIDAASVALSPKGATPQKFLLCQAGSLTGLYSYACPGDPSPLGTRFSRVITLITPLDELVTTVVPNATIPAADIMQIIVTVSWTNAAGSQQTHTQKNILYKWR
ncbi:MAG: hypothetical protein UX72_C0008G0017 [Parcubacteria group bacterium GW2011_GWA2_47_10]|nr:MAG: hypothetical protein UX72_C0008G0017 [Parcubacteria group bacterium GW2011_GWA2_47_10]